MCGETRWATTSPTLQHLPPASTSALHRSAAVWRSGLADELLFDGSLCSALDVRGERKVLVSRAFSVSSIQMKLGISRFRIDVIWNMLAPSALLVRTI
jgi:hypothetical protein